MALPAPGARRVLLTALLLAAGAGATPLRAQPGGDEATPAPNRPAAAGRTVARFDFEERAFNPEPVPRYWFRAQHSPPERVRPGFPAWNKAEFDRTSARSGTTSVRLPTRGGSTALRLGGMTVPVFPTADYRVSAAVRTEGVTHARAFIEATLLDSAGTPIQGATFRTAPILTPDWSDVQVIVPGRWANAAFVQLELQLLQPERFGSRGALGDHTVWPEDYSGAALFDDLTVTQMPRVSLAARAGAAQAGGPGGGSAVAFDAVVRDLAGEVLTARLTLKDIDGRTVAAETRELPRGGEALAWSPVAPALGWYEASLDVLSGAAVVGGARCTVLVLPRGEGAPGGAGQPRSLALSAESPFAVIAGPAPEEVYPAITAALIRTGIRSATLSLVPDVPASATDTPVPAPFRESLDELLDAGVSPSVAIVGLGPGLARALRSPVDGPWGLAGAEEAAWLPSLQRLFDLYGQRVTRWQIGDAFAGGAGLEGDLAGRMGRFRDTLSRFVPGPKLALAWQAGTPWPTPVVSGRSSPAFDSVTLAWPGDRDTALILADARALRSSPLAGELTVVLSPAAGVSRRAALDGLMQRTVMWWAALDPAGPALGRASPPRFAIQDPWSIEGGMHPALHPEPALAAWRTLSAGLSGRRIVGEITDNAAPGVRCFILAPGSGAGGSRTGALVAWDERPGERARFVTGYFGGAPLEVVDAFGNRTAAAPPDASGRWRIATSSTPVFIENVDADLARFLAGARISPDFVPAVAAVHEHEVHLINPWPTTISGSVQLLPPEGGGAGRRNWRFTPTSPMSFTIQPGQTARLPFSFSFSASEEAGGRTINAVIAVAADRSYPAMRVLLPITIGLADLDVAATIAPSPGADGPDAMVTVTVTNTGRQNRTMQLDMQAPGLPSQQQPVSNLAGGERAVRRFVVRNGAAVLSGRRVRVSLYDVDGTERLNKYVMLP